MEVRLANACIGSAINMHCSLRVDCSDDFAACPTLLPQLL